jgi:uncharacterized protein YfkK (UPF0435 family)
MHQNDNSYLKDHEYDFEHIHHLKDIFRVVHFKTNLNYKSIID